jgi:glycerate 2-kinase
MMRIIIALDKYKGSLSALAACQAVERGLHRAAVAAKMELCPIADGGEGTTEALVGALSAGWREITVQDALGRPRLARYGLSEDGLAVMEMSAASGLAIVADQPLQPDRASTYGTGQMLADALSQGAGRVIMGIGGSATNDGGMGLALALGFEFLDPYDRPVVDLPAQWSEVARIRPSRPLGSQVQVACDVDNLLLGPKGASAVYGPQKGVTDVPAFERRLYELADMVSRDLGCDYRNYPGAGAAGGLGFGLMSFAGAELVSGFDLVAQVLDLEHRIQDADLVITGEGRLDAQTLHGKGPAGVAAMARRHGVPVIAIAGLVQDAELMPSLFNEVIEVKPESMPVAEAMLRGAELIEEKVVQQAALIMAVLRSST